HRLDVIGHQISHDGVSVYSVLAPELFTLYESFVAGSPSPLPEPAVQYADYAAWQREARHGDEARSIDYWREQLAGAPTALDLPTDRARPPVQSFRGRQLSFVIDKDLAAALQRLSESCGATLFMTLV